MIKKTIVVALLFLFITSIAAADANKPKFEGKTILEQKIEPLIIYIHKDSPSLLYFSQFIKSYYVSNNADFQVKTFPLEPNVLRFKTNIENATTFIIVESQDNSIVYFIKMVEDDTKNTENAYWIALAGQKF